MQLSIHRNRILLRDGENNSNYLNNRNCMARRPSHNRDALSDRGNGNTRSRLSTASTAAAGKLNKAKTLISPLSIKSSEKMFINYNNMFVDNKPAHPVKRNYRSINSVAHYPPLAADKGDSISLFSEDSYWQTRLSGGANRTQQQVDKLLASPSQCKSQPAGFEYFDPRKKLNVIHLQLNDSHNNMNFDCHELPLPRATGNSRTRATQTLYRESSAQTLPYLPGVINDPEELETLEVFKLPTILPGDGPPGFYEVEVLERARKRWAFAKALKENFRKQLQEARDHAKLQQHHHVLEAFEWEHWLEREEYIQECQMLRLELLIRMFDKREREMHTASHIRIQKSCELIEAQRQTALKKNEIEYERALRRLETKHAKQPRVWRKEHITKELGDPSSEFYAPKMRYGVNPNRRHFTASRKGFNMRMDDLEKRAIKMDYKHLKCPFAKLKEWSKPKEVLQEVEQNFCSDNNLKKLYESMRTLRESSKKQNSTPLCLKTKSFAPTIQEEEENNIHPDKVTSKKTIGANQILIDIKSKHSDSEDSEYSQIKHQQEEMEHKQALEELRKQKEEERLNMEMLQKEMRCEELESLISSYEGHTIGWLMRFLSEEMCRVKEQRKLHFFTMMAKRQRWHREAAEAGLRQKENFLREEYEQLYEECDKANREVAEKFLSDIMDTDIKDYAKETAQDYVTTMAKDLDKEISGWLESFRDIQTPLNYYSLRNALKDIVMPDKEKILSRLERDDCVQYIINDVLLANVYQLHSATVKKTHEHDYIANDLVDRLIDNDIYLDSTDGSSECECLGFCTCSKARQEAKAILRKVIRRAVPGRRWHTPNERVVAENVRDILDEVFDKVIPTDPTIEVDMKTPLNVNNQGSHIDLVYSNNDVIYTDVSEHVLSEGDDMFKVSFIGSPPKPVDVKITKSLENTEKLLLADTDKISEDRVLIQMDKYEVPQAQYQPQKVHATPSAYNISKIWDFNKTPVYNQTSSDDFEVEENKEILEEEMLAKIQENSGSEIVDEMKNDIESWELEMSDQNYEEEYEEEQTIEEFEDSNQQEAEGMNKSEENELFPTEDKIVQIRASTIDASVHFNERTEEEIIEKDTEIKEIGNNDETDVFMEVLFSYDPTVKYSVPVPSGNETLERNIDNISDDGNNAGENN